MTFIGTALLFGMQIHSMESFSAVDGHGIRTVIFLQGCQRRCVFCSNPDTWKLSVWFLKVARLKGKKGKDDGKPMSSKTIAKQLKRFLPYMKSSGGGVTCSGYGYSLSPCAIGAHYGCILSPLVRLVPTTGLLSRLQPPVTNSLVVLFCARLPCSSRLLRLTAL
eukprot:1194866-Prorocentrum_minimum.AAC.4